MHTLDQYRGTIVACRYGLPSTLTRVDALQTVKAAFYDAAVRVILAQPHLQIGYIGENTSNPQIVRLDRIDLRNHFEWHAFQDSSHLERQHLEMMQSQLDKRYENLATQPGWRVIVLHQDGSDSLEAMYVWNHPHHDGMSGKIFHQQLLRNLNDKSSPKGDLTYEEDSPHWYLDLPDNSSKLPPPPEILSSFQMTVPFLVKALWKELKPYWLFPPTPMHATWAPVKKTPFCTRFCTVTVENETVERLVGICRQHHTTITGLLQALVLVSLTSRLDNMTGFASRTPYDLRHYLPSHTKEYPWLKPKEAMCNYVSVLDHEFEPELVAAIRAKQTETGVGSSHALSADIKDMIWSIAARVRREIAARLESGITNDMISIMKFVTDWRPQQESETRKPRYLSWLVTNLGVLERGDDEPDRAGTNWSLQKAELVLSTEVPSAAISVSVMTVAGERMAVTCSWQDCVVDQELGKHLLDDLQRWLNEIGASS
jgi:hypothetical protein